MRSHTESTARTPELTCRARDMMGEWLSGVKWSHISTLTFAFQVSPKVAEREFRRWKRRLEQRAQHRIAWFYSVERSAGGLLHLHVLTAYTERLSVGALREAWPNGIGHVVEYSPSKPGVRYVCKDIGRKTEYYDLDLGGEPALAQCQGSTPWLFGARL